MWVEPTLAETSSSLNGDLDSVLALIEDNQQFQQQLRHKAYQVGLVRKAATDLLMNSSTGEDSANVKDQLDLMNELWERVDAFAKDRTTRLESRLEWLGSFFNRANIAAVIVGILFFVLFLSYSL